MMANWIAAIITSTSQGEAIMPNWVAILTLTVGMIAVLAALGMIVVLIVVLVVRRR